MAKYRTLLTAPTKTPPDRSLGRALFAKTCQQCHTLFGVGGNVGPDITGSNRASLDYLLENILDPSAVIPKEYAATVITLNNGRTITGIINAHSGTGRPARHDSPAGYGSSRAVPPSPCRPGRRRSADRVR